jgi:toxin ParE1/3/4
MRLEFSRFVEQDLEAIADFIAADNPSRAVTFIRQIRDAILKIGKQPFIYQLRPEIGAAARLAVVGHYVILFRVVTETVRIERVVYVAATCRNCSRILRPRPPSEYGQDRRCGGLSRRWRRAWCRHDLPTKVGLSAPAGPHWSSVPFAHLRGNRS